MATSLRWIEQTSRVRAQWNLEYNEGLSGDDLVSTWVAKQNRAYRGLVTS
jgi:hypothetical protein